MSVIDFLPTGFSVLTAATASRFLFAGIEHAAFMGRIRTIKPEFWVSEQVVECSPNARLLFIGMWNFCDDGGNHPASPKSLKMQVFPGDDFTVTYISDLIDELKNQRLIAEYTGNDGKNYWHVTGWHHQKIDRPSFKYPKFDERSSNDRRTPPPGKDSSGEDSSGESGNAHDAAENSADSEPKKNVSPQVPAAPPQKGWMPVDPAAEIEAMRSDDLCRERFFTVERLPLENYDAYLDKFLAKVKSEQHGHNNRKDFRSHFFSWSRLHSANHGPAKSTTPTTPSPNGPPQRATIMHYQNGRPALKEKQKF